MQRRRAKYFTPTKYGTRGAIRIDTVLYQQHFPHGTDSADMWQWLIDTELAHRKNVPGQTTFHEDAIRYLQAVASMTSYSDRKRHIQAWMAVFEKDRTRRTITSADIAKQLHIWRQTKSASTCNHLRTALQHLWSTLDGRAATNPVRDVAKFKEPSTVPRALDYTTIRRILKAVSSPVDRARLTLIAYAGLPHTVIGALTEASVTGRTLAIPGRLKGHGTRGQAIPLRAEAVAALKVLKTHNAWGPFDRWHLRRVFNQALVTAQVRGKWRPYDLRHSFATEAYRQSGDIGAVQTLMLHSTESLTRRYALAAVNLRAKAALKNFGK